MKIVEWPLKRLKPYGKNPRRNDQAVDRMCEVIKEYGFLIPILATSAGEVIDGHLRLKAATKMALPKVPVVLADGLTEERIKAFRILANKSVAWAEWDEELLRSELLDLKTLGFDLELTGFDGSELQALFGAGADEPKDVEDVPEPPADPVTRLGDVWLCGRHRVACLDSTDIAAVRGFLGDAVIDFSNVDPPYGIAIVKGKNGGRATDGGAKAFGHIGGHQHTAKNELGAKRGKVHSPGQDGFSRGRGHGPAKRAIIRPGLYSPIIGDETTETAIKAYGVLTALKVPAIVMWGGNYYANALPPSRCWLVWDKENSGSFADCELAWTNRDAVVKLFRHQWNGLIKASERGQKRVHPTQKPVALAEWVRQTVAPKAKTVLDLFLGGAAVLIDAERAGITCYGAELSPAYCDVSVARWTAMSDQWATLEATGETFAQVAARRIAERDNAA